MGGAAKLLHPIREFRARKARKWYAVLVDEDLDKIGKAMKKLGRIDHPLTLAACVNSLASALPEIRSWAAMQIGYKRKYFADDKLRDTAYKKIENLLLSDQLYLREAAVDAIMQIDDPEFAVECVKKLLGSKKDACADEISLMIRVIDMLDGYKARHETAEKILRWLLKEPAYERYREDIRVALKAEG